MTTTARGNDLQWAELGEEPSASSARAKNSTSDGRRAHLAETAVGTSLPSSRAMPASILDSPGNQTPSSAAQSIPPTGGNRLRQQVVGRVGGEGRLGASFLHKPPSGREALPWLRLSKGPGVPRLPKLMLFPLPFPPASGKDHSIKSICLTHCLGPETQIQSWRVLQDPETG